MPKRIGYDDIFIRLHHIGENIWIVANDIDVEPEDPRMIPLQRAREKIIPRSGYESSPDGLSFETVTYRSGEIEVEVLGEDVDRVVTFFRWELCEVVGDPFELGMSLIG